MTFIAAQRCGTDLMSAAFLGIRCFYSLTKSYKTLQMLAWLLAARRRSTLYTFRAGSSKPSLFISNASDSQYLKMNRKALMPQRQCSCLVYSLFATLAHRISSLCPIKTIISSPERRRNPAALLLHSKVETVHCA